MNDAEERRRLRLERLDILGKTLESNLSVSPIDTARARAPLTLEEALRENEERKIQAQKLAAEMAPEIEKRRALQATLDSLPRDERRRVLDAAGMRHISAAPAPITPLRGSGSYWPTRRELPLVQPLAKDQGPLSNAPSSIEAEVPPSNKNRSDERAAAALKRRNADITRERGSRRRIIENWDAIELEYWPKIDGHVVLRVLMRDKQAEQVVLKTVQNNLIDLRAEGLIP